MDHSNYIRGELQRLGLRLQLLAQFAEEAILRHDTEALELILVRRKPVLAEVGELMNLNQAVAASSPALLQAARMEAHLAELSAQRCNEMEPRLNLLTRQMDLAERYS